MLGHAQNAKPLPPIAANGVGMGTHKTNTKKTGKRPATEARDELERLQALRDKNGGHIVPMPGGLENAAVVSLTPEEKLAEPTGDTKWNDDLYRVDDWLKEIRKAGGLAADVWFSFCAWEPRQGGLARNTIRKKIDAGAYSDLKRERDLFARAESEALPARVRRSMRTRVRQIEIMVEEIDKKREPLLDELERAKRQLQEHEHTWDLSGES